MDRRNISHYRILSELGRGGMGIVYKARDEKLQRDIALKVLRSEFAQSDDSRKRFLREARIAARVDHPYIAAIYDADEEDGTLFIAMQYIEGLTLRQRMKQDDLRLRDMLRHAVEIAEGLAAAHRAGVVHRDLKPENIMITEAHAKILDFGLAKLHERRDQENATVTDVSTSTRLTSEHTRLGTPAYMSPEQVRSSRVDERSDVFSFGSTIYELFTARGAFRRRNQADTLAAILKEEPPAMGPLNPEMPVDLQQILNKCLKKDPDERYQDTRDLAIDLREVKRDFASGSAVTYSSQASPPTYAPRLTEEDTMTVRESAGTVRDAVSGTSSVPTPAASSGSSGFRYRGIVYGLVAALVVVAGFIAWSGMRKSSPPRQVFYERGLHYLREESESISSISNAIAMFHRAVSADSTSALAWAGLAESYWMRFERTRSQVSFDEAQSALDHAMKLGPRLPGTFNARGRGLLAQKKYEEARNVLLEAVSEDESNDIAWAYLGRAYQGLNNYAKGQESIQESIRLQPTDFRHHIALGNFYRGFGEYEPATSAYQDALALKPNSPIAWNNLGSILLMSKPQEAAKAFERALQADPDYGAAWSNLGTASYYMQDYQAAEESYRRAVQLEPRRVVHYTNLADALVMLDKKEEYRQVYVQASELAREEVATKPDDAEARIRLGLFCARAGDVQCAVDAAALAQALQPENDQILFRTAKIMGLLNRPNTALDHLERAVKLGLKKAEIENDPDLIQLHRNPRFVRILELAN